MSPAPLSPLLSSPLLSSHPLAGSPGTRPKQGGRPRGRARRRVAHGARRFCWLKLRGSSSPRPVLSLPSRSRTRTYLRTLNIPLWLGMRGSH
ncbi:hypothetical protein FKP32DRAFT_875453 [Trametes sanguinea]|nr:hypothetical protein FKP32DRAFT_875453 [Trametes sanguinea]